MTDPTGRALKVSSRDALILLALLANVVAVVWRAATVSNSLDNLATAESRMEVTVSHLMDLVNANTAATRVNDARLHNLEAELERRKP